MNTGLLASLIGFAGGAAVLFVVLEYLSFSVREWLWILKHILGSFRFLVAVIWAETLAFVIIMSVGTRPIMDGISFEDQIFLLGWFSMILHLGLFCIGRYFTTGDQVG